MTPSVEILHAQRPFEIDAVRELLREYIAWVVTLEEGSVCAPPLSGLPNEIETLPGIYSPPRGRLLLALNNGEPAGVVCLKPRSEGTSEVKRLYVRPSHRGHDIGRQLIERLLDEARDCGYRRLILDSHVTMKGAHRLYEAVGFQYVQPFADFPPELAHVAVFMELNLP